ncbi:MAG: hypothetical protein KW793_04775 [Candidatus Doudnabacteria bacterium]|nr:hypothetical protein [Candidatus Doudnabacteria bacterium]
MLAFQVLRIVYEELIAECKDRISPVVIDALGEPVMAMFLQDHWSAISYSESGESSLLRFYMVKPPSTENTEKVEEGVVAITDNFIMEAATWKVVHQRKKPGVWRKGKGYKMTEKITFWLQSKNVKSFEVSKQCLDLLQRLAKRIGDLTNQIRLREGWEAEFQSNGNYEKPDN